MHDQVPCLIGSDSHWLPYTGVPEIRPHISPSSALGVWGSYIAGHHRGVRLLLGALWGDVNVGGLTCPSLLWDAPLLNYHANYHSSERWSDIHESERHVPASHRLQH